MAIADMTLHAIELELECDYRRGLWSLYIACISALSVLPTRIVRRNDGLCAGARPSGWHNACN